MVIWLLVLFALAWPQGNLCSACTTILVGKHASSSGFPIATHANDCFDCDHRVVKIPSRIASKGLIDVFAASFDFPRLVRYDKGPEYMHHTVDTFSGTQLTWPESKAIASISDKPVWKIVVACRGEDAHRQNSKELFGYLDGSYGIQNEVGLSIGESTCASKLVNKPVFDGGKALFDISSVTRIALQYCRTAFCAVKVMGFLAEKYGYYGAEWKGPDAYSESGETITLADAYGDAFLFAVLPDGKDESAVWVAVKLADDHVTSVTNAFTIGRIDHLTQGKTVVHSKNLYSIARDSGWWEMNEPFDFSAVYAPKLAKPHAAYYQRRQWKIFDALAPSLHLDSESLFPHPFSIKPDHQVPLEQLMALHRDFYAGTKYDLTKGLAAGPYGSPTRHDGSNAGHNHTLQDIYSTGNFERPISMFRTAYTSIAVAHSHLSLSHVFFAPGCAHSSIFSVLFPQVHQLPHSLGGSSNLWKFEHSSMFWQVQLIHGWTDKYFDVIQPLLVEVQRHVEEGMLRTVKIFEMRFLSLHDEWGSSVADFQHLSDVVCSHAFKTYEDLFPEIVTRFHDGLHAFPHASLRRSDKPLEALQAAPPVYELDTEHLFYPLWWLRAVGFFGDEHTSKHPKQSVSAPKQGHLHRIPSHSPESTADSQGLYHIKSNLLLVCKWSLVFLLTMAIGVLIGMWIMSRSGSQYSRSMNGYPAALLSPRSPLNYATSPHSAHSPSHP